MSNANARQRLCRLVILLLGAAAGVARAASTAMPQEPQNWSYAGRDAQGTYYSPLTKINASTVGRLGFAWAYDLGLPRRGQEATPIVIDGLMITSGTWGYVYALDAATGQERWRYDPQAAPAAARNPCCDLVNRGVAVWRGKVYVASLDGRLHALDAASGRKLWEADSIVDHRLPYSSTGAPQIATVWISVCMDCGSVTDRDADAPEERLLEPFLVWCERNHCWAELARSREFPWDFFCPACGCRALRGSRWE